MAKHDKYWYNQIPLTLWLYRTNIRIPTEEITFPLVNGEKAIIPLELEIPFFQVSPKGIYKQLNLHFWLFNMYLFKCFI